MAGLNLANIAAFDAGVRDRQSQDRAAESETLRLEGERMAMERARRENKADEEARAATSSTWADAKKAAESFNAGVRERNSPEEVASEFGSMWRNRATGEVTDDKAKAYGVVPEKTTTSIFEKEYAARVRDVYMQNGMPEKAAQFDDFMSSRTGKRYLQEAHKGLAAIAMGDKQGGLQILNDLYNSQVKDGRYSTFTDLGNGTTEVKVFDSKTGQSTTTVIQDADLGQRAAQFLDPQFLAKHVLETRAANAKITMQYNADVAKLHIEAVYKGDLEKQKIAMQTRAKLIENVQQAQLDTMLGKGTVIEMDPSGLNIIVSQPGRGVFKLEKGALVPVKNGETSLGAGSFNISLDRLMGVLDGQGVGVGAAQSAAPAAPAAPATGVNPPAEAIEMLRTKNTPEMRKFFDATFGPGAADKVIPATKAPAAAPRPTPAPRPVAPAPEAAPAAAPSPAAGEFEGVETPAQRVGVKLGQFGSYLDGLTKKQIDDYKKKLADGAKISERDKLVIKALAKKQPSAFSKAELAAIGVKQ